tara:strand:- start:4894 stop:5586 length:693 start_codon:yes stop_codon:yes gene_type:complete
MTNRLAILPAAGTSKRLPRKNILPIQNTPMLAYPINTCLQSKLFDRVIVSTEDSEIANIAEAEGASVHKRDKSLSTDEASIAQVCMALLTELATEGYRPDTFCCVYATAIFLTPTDLTDSFALLGQEDNTRMVVGVSSFNLQPHQAMFENDGYLEAMWPDVIRKKSQQIPELVASNGTLIWTKTSEFLEETGFPASKIRGYRIPYFRAIDIDTPEDYRTASLLARQQKIQ